jgi:hypothetical protein
MKSKVRSFVDRSNWVQKLPNEVDQTNDANQNSTPKNTDDEIENLELDISGDFEQGFVGYKAFIPQDNFSSKLSHKEIEKNIRNALVSEHSFTKLVCKSQSSYDFFVLTFDTKEKKEEYVNKGIKNICEKLYNYDQTSFNNYIKLKLKNQDTYIIKIVDVPTNFDSSIVINHLINITGKKVKSYHDHIKSPNQPPNQTGRQQRFKLRYPKFKQIWVYFEDNKALEYIYKEDIWSMSIESFIVRIIPSNTKHEEYSKRTSFYYKITGLSLNTSVQDMIPILQHLAGKTCTFNDQGRYSMTKSAFIYTKENNFKPKKQKTTFHKHTIYILPQYIDYTCVNCGSPNHRIKDCTDEEFTQNGPHKIFKKRFIPRNNPMIITDKNINDEYKHVIQMNRSIKLQKRQTQDQAINQRNRGKTVFRENPQKDFRPQRYRSKSKGEHQNK